MSYVVGSCEEESEMMISVYPVMLVYMIIICTLKYTLAVYMFWAYLTLIVRFSSPPLSWLSLAYAPWYLHLVLGVAIFIAAYRVSHRAVNRPF